MLSSAIATNVAAHLQVVSDLKWSARARAIGMRAVADALDLLESDRSLTCDTMHEAWAGSDTRFKDVPYAGATYSVMHDGDDARSGAQSQYGLTDEEGKINVNRAPVAHLAALLRLAGMIAAQADDVASYIVDWRDANTAKEGGAGPEACASVAVPSRCKNASFESLEELWWMPGMTPAIYDVLQRELTLYGAGTVNANTATSLALQALGLTAHGADRLIAWRSRAGNVFDNASAIIAHAAEMGMTEPDRVKLGTIVAAGSLGTFSNFYRGLVLAEYGGRTRTVAQFLLDRGEKTIRWWRE